MKPGDLVEIALITDGTEQDFGVITEKAGYDIAGPLWKVMIDGKFCVFSEIELEVVNETR
jgi:hypothetical protein